MLRLLCVLSLGLVATALARDVPYVPTPHAVVEKMLEVAKVGPNTEKWICAARQALCVLCHG